MKFLDKHGPRFVQLGFLALLLLAWYLAGKAKAINPIILPTLDEVGSELMEVVQGGRVWSQLWVTLREYLTAIAISFPCGLAIGYLISRSQYLVRAFDPIIAGLYAIPGIVLLPLFVLYFGLDSPSKIAIGAKISFFPVALYTIAGFSTVNPVYINAARSMGASSFQMFRSVLLPAAFPVILTGIRLGSIGAFLSILGAETISSLRGLGREIATQAEMFNTPGVFAYIVFALILVLIINWTVLHLEAIGKRRTT